MAPHSRFVTGGSGAEVALERGFLRAVGGVAAVVASTGLKLVDRFVALGFEAVVEVLEAVGDAVGGNNRRACRLRDNIARWFDPLHPKLRFRAFDANLQRRRSVA